jgi:hypothetical protein
VLFVVHPTFAAIVAVLVVIVVVTNQVDFALPSIYE